MSLKHYDFVVEGTDHRGNTWSTTGSVAGEFADCLTRACHASFMQLTSGKAVYGNPGAGCRGPYVITRYVLTLKPDA